MRNPNNIIGFFNGVAKNNKTLGFAAWTGYTGTAQGALFIIWRILLEAKRG